LFADAGIAASRLTAIGYADTRPVEPNLLADGRARNRRVTILIDSEIPEKSTELDLQGSATPPTGARTTTPAAVR
jgi:chemotaxis protein MotB